MEAHFPWRSWHSGQTGRRMKIIFPLYVKEQKGRGGEDRAFLLGCLYLRTGKGENAPHPAHTYNPLPMLLPKWASLQGRSTPMSAKQHWQPSKHCQAQLPCYCAHPFSSSFQTPITTMRLQCHGNEKPSSSRWFISPRKLNPGLKAEC